MVSAQGGMQRRELFCAIERNKLLGLNKKQSPCRCWFWRAITGKEIHMKRSRKSAQRRYRHSLVGAFNQILFAPLLRPVGPAGANKVI